MKRLLQIGILFLTLVSILVTIVPLLNGSYFSMHDRQHVVRLYLLDTAIHQGYWYPRWVDGLGFGYGYALFNFYPPLVYYIAMAFRLVGFGYIWSLKLMLISGFVASFFGMFLLIKRVTASTSIGILSAQLYLLAQYHSALVYVRGAFAEFFGYNLLPWVFYSFILLAEKKQPVWFALTFALLVLAHPFVAFPFVMMFLVFFAVYSVVRNDRVELFWRTGISALWGLGFSAFFWLPSMVERSLTLVDTILTRQMADYKQHFVYIRQLLNSAWGYGGSIPGPEDGLSFEIGKVHMLLILMAGGVLLFFVYKRDKHTISKLVMSIPFLAGVVLAVFMVLFKSQFVWEKITFLWYLQFPWRFLVFVAFFSSAGGVLWLLLLSKRMRYALVGLLMLCSLLVYGPVFKPEKYLSGNDNDYTTQEQIVWEQSKTSFEFMSRNVDTFVKNNAVYFIESKEDIPTSLFNLSTTGASGSVVENLFESKAISVAAHQDTRLTLNRSYLPGWVAYIDKQVVSVKTSKPAQTMSVYVPKGNHLIQFKFEETPVRRIGWLVTAIAILFLFQPKKIYDTLIARSRKTTNKLERPLPRK